MLWQELEVSRALSDVDLVQAWSLVFSVDSESVLVVDTMEDAPPVSDTRIRIVLERWRQPGQFPLHVVVYVRGADLGAGVSKLDGSLDLVRRFCATAECDCLLSDDDVNPHTMILVRRTGQVCPVVLDGDALDRDKLVIAASQPVESPTVAGGRPGRFGGPPE
jgi:hypothetical protein